VTPSQVPPHAEPSVVQVARGAIGAPVTARQLPRLPAMLQASHCEVQLELQQKPSAQNPLEHWPAEVQATPRPSIAAQ